jgi:hypothetical protein
MGEMQSRVFGFQIRGQGLISLSLNLKTVIYCIPIFTKNKLNVTLVYTTLTISLKKKMSRILDRLCKLFLDPVAEWGWRVWAHPTPTRFAKKAYLFSCWMDGGTGLIVGQQHTLLFSFWVEQKCCNGIVARTQYAVYSQ